MKKFKSLISILRPLKDQHFFNTVWNLANSYSKVAMH